MTAADVAAWLDVLEASGVITRYTVADANYLAVTNWSEHQRPSHPARSVIPDPPRDSADSRGIPEPSEKVSTIASESYGNPPESLARVTVNGSPEQRAGSSEQGAEERKSGSPAAHVIPADFTLTLDRKKWAKENTPAVHAERETAGFVDYWRGEHGKKKNWETLTVLLWVISELS
ncbi:hypothetical protein AB6813_15280 [bacterium RCC_150]